MGKPQAKKQSQFETEMTKSVFLYGKPNKAKADALIGIQKAYTGEVNRFIGLIDKEKSLLIPLVKDDRHSSELRAFEKENRGTSLNCSYSQSAFDMAVDILSNRLTNIRHELHGVLDCPLTESKVLFAMTLLGRGRTDMVAFLDKMLQPRKKNREFYGRLKSELPDGAEFDAMADEVRVLCACIMDGYALPHVDKAEVRAVPQAFSLKANPTPPVVLEESESIAAPYVIELADPAHKRKRICVPLNASRDAVRRLRQYGANATVNYTIRDDGQLRVTVSFNKRPREPEVTSYKGVDVGIVDMLHTSDGDAFGTFRECEQFYTKTVEPSLGYISSLRNKKRAIRHFLRKHKKALPGAVIMGLRQKMDRLETMIRSAKEPNRKLNRYRDMEEHGVKAAVDAYIASLGGDKGVCTVLELLDLREYRRSKRQNQSLSNFARGLLTEKLMKELNWHGYTFLQVDPAYTSQECPVCHNVTRENRDGKSFKCTCCGHEDDADHVGAVNILSRATDEELADIAERLRYNTVGRHKEIKAVITRRHEEWEARQPKQAAPAA